MSVAEGGNPDSGDEIEIAAAIGAVQPGTFGTRNFQTERRAGSLCEVLKKKTFEITHRGPP
jgi:hypothetical protein